jgi:hypothetical protein
MHEYKYEINPMGHISCLERTVQQVDGENLIGIWHARNIAPGDDVSSESKEVQELALVFHTNDRIAAYRKDALLPPLV